MSIIETKDTNGVKNDITLQLARLQGCKIRQTPEGKLQSISRRKPKRGLTSYMFFSREQRLKPENEELTFTELGDKVAGLWRSLSDDEKKPYDMMSNNDKKRCQKQLEKWIMDFPEEGLELVENLKQRALRKENKAKKASKKSRDTIDNDGDLVM